MAPTDKAVLEWQTTEIIRCLFNDQIRFECGRFEDCIESDGPGLPPFKNKNKESLRLHFQGPAAPGPIPVLQGAHSSDEFDPIQIADKLRCIADDLNDDLAFQAALNELKTAVAKEAAEAAFGLGVEALCQSQVSQRAEVAPEMQIIRASVAFGLYVKKSAPELKNTVQSAMTAFLNRRVGAWVAQQGGWGRV